MSPTLTEAEADVLDSLQRGPMSVADLAEDTGRSDHVTAKAVRGLVSKGAVAEAGQIMGSKGKSVRGGCLTGTEPVSAAEPMLMTRALSLYPDGATVTQLAFVAGLAPDQARNQLRRLNHQGLARTNGLKGGHSRWFPMAPPAEVPEGPLTLDEGTVTLWLAANPGRAARVMATVRAHWSAP
jgi:DNA-binding IclR family transcriptional regulator